MPVVDTTNGMYALHAACTAAAAGGFRATTIPLAVTSVGVPAASVYLVTISEPIDASVCVPMVCTTGTTCLIASVVQLTDTTFSVSTFDDVGVAADSDFAFTAYRTSP